MVSVLVDCGLTSVVGLVINVDLVESVCPGESVVIRRDLEGFLWVSYDSNLVCSEHACVCMWSCGVCASDAGRGGGSSVEVTVSVGVEAAGTDSLLVASEAVWSYVSELGAVADHCETVAEVSVEVELGGPDVAIRTETSEYAFDLVVAAVVVLCSPKLGGMSPSLMTNCMLKVPVSVTAGVEHAVGSSLCGIYCHVSPTCLSESVVRTCVVGSESVDAIGSVHDFTSWCVCSLVDM